MAMAGEVSVASLTAAGSEAKTEFGGESDRVVVVDHPEDPEAAFSQLDGKEDAASKAWLNTTTGTPERNAKLAVPRLFVPSCNWSVGVTIEPQAPPETNEKLRVTAGPPGTSTP